ncbi:type IV toxin-antitoxin system AbiEi family antitoxin domain-containing protein [Sporosarcina sp. FSL K6-3457]|uniref:type IV toxin-antitoxin system AbiEi family antitoxin domain-containing protein n=1 Tax=Sporosarcina sp. FSL K6-3457 TaxID=2978204 RepID=UPI0030FB1157
MDYRKMLDSLIEQCEGLVLTKDVTGAGIPRTYLSSLVKEDILERVAHGVYLTRDAFDDELYSLQARSSRLIYSHETALYLHDLTDRDPLQWVGTVPSGYNSTNLKNEGVKVYTVKRELHQLGTTTGQTEFGRKITLYNRERTICDIIRSRNKMDSDLINETIRRYVGSKDKNIPLLLRYAEQLRVQKILQNYLEILL